MSNLWTRCNNCRRILYKQDILDNLSVCPACGFHFRLSATERLAMLFDDGQYNLIDQNIFPQDPLQFEDSIKYSDRLKEHKKRTSLHDAVLNAEGKMGGIRVIISAMDFAFMGGSMGSVVGEKITRAAELALKERAPFITVSCSGGARMQEGVLSLMQLMKTSSAIANLNEAGIPFISVLADPTTGGVTASFAMLGDINIAEPNALIGFAGPRVIEQTIKEKLPKGFQRSEFLLEHGMLDDVVSRKNMRSYIIRALHLFLNSSE
ncbi:MAG: acetyl-CoA carboxylase carboxyltransferase subunit beta [Candidatus Aminicenantes bacterium]|nr:acetyl-CoA carboxylase carboxyltransferase subunit beta [Candidatus Aminicenantes bacterium]